MPPWLILLFLAVMTASSCPQEPCPCFPTSDRHEVRTLSAEQRSRVAAAFRTARNLVPRTEWTRNGPAVCLLVNSLDAALRPARFPFWDSRIEERMANPSDSPLFSGRFFPDKANRKRRKIRQRRIRSELPSLPQMSPSLFVALRSGRHAHLLSFLHSIGTQMRPFVNDSCSSLCPNSSEFTTCSRDFCWSRIRPGAVCSESSQPSCYNSICVNEVCSVPTSRPSQKNETQTSLYQIVNLPSNKEEIEGSGEIGSRSEIDSAAYYSISSPEDVKPETLTTEAPKVTKLITKLTTKKFLTNNEEMEFDASTTFPTVYFPITIVKQKHSRRYAGDKSVKILTKGANFPNGYTQKILGLYVNSTRGVVRVLDPMLASTAIEAEITVKQGDVSCEAFCKMNDDGYKACRNTVRLSKFVKISDPIKWYNNTSFIPWKWIGSGYYKRPVYDYLMFKC